VPGQRQKIKGIWRKTMYDSSKDNLIPITEIANNLGLVVRKHDFGEEEYIPITMIPVKELYSDREYQRLLNGAMIKKAGRFSGSLCRPLAVFERPDGKYAVSDGQHTSTIGYLYTNQGGELCVPCQVQVHPKDRTLEECVAVEAKYFEELNKNRTNVGAIETLRSGIAYGNKESLETEQKLISMGVHIEHIGDVYGHEVSGLSRILEAHAVGDNLRYVKKAIEIYSKLIEESNAPNWSEVPMSASLIAGLARVWYLRDNLGKGDKGYVVEKYLTERLSNTSPKNLTEGTSGNSQSHLIAVRIVTKINTLIEESVLTKKDGTPLKHQISEGEIRDSGIIDPTKIK
jgi:hypothetical protein